MAVSSAAAKDDGDEALERALRQCAEIHADDARLRCFDELASESAADAGQEMDADAAAAQPQSAFGSDSLRRSRSEPEPSGQRISATITSLVSRPRGERVFTLSNGQVWTELEAGRSRYREGMAVTIERTPLGAYMLSTAGGRATRVRRIE